MKNRLMSVLSHQGTLALVVVLLAGGVWLVGGTHYLSEDQASPAVAAAVANLSAAGLPEGTTPAPRLLPSEGCVAEMTPVGQGATPTRPLNAGTRAMLAAFPLPSERLLLPGSGGLGALCQAKTLEAPRPRLFPPQPIEFPDEWNPHLREAFEPVTEAESAAPPELPPPLPLVDPSSPDAVEEKPDTPPETLVPATRTRRAYLRTPRRIKRRSSTFGLNKGQIQPLEPEVDFSLPPPMDETPAQREPPARLESRKPQTTPQPDATQEVRTTEPALESPLPPIASPANRSRDLELIAREADTHSRRGFDLAGRKACFSARAEFLMALRLVAQGLDAEHQTKAHGRALAAGWTALKEADDFIPRGSRLEAELDLAGIIGRHQTPVLQGTDPENLTQLIALQCYFTFAQEQLAQAAGEEVAGSMALHGLGNLYRALAAKQSGLVRAATPKALVCYQAALLVSPHNYMASNELGVLLARGGRYQEAQNVLEHSVRECEQSVGWHNLAVVYQRLGRTDLARHASAQCRALRQARGENRPANTGHQVEWVQPSVFTRLLGNHPGLGPPLSAHALSFQWITGAAHPIEPATQRVLKASYETGQALPHASGACQQPPSIQLCQALGPAAPCNICAVDCACCDWSRRGGWERARAIAWQAYAQGEYVGHERTAHVPEYRLRVDDQLDLVYRVTREETSTPYRLNVGDEVRVESFTDEELNRDLIIQPDGTITLRLLGQVRATGRTVAQLREAIEEAYKKYYPVPAITVTPLQVNTQLEDLRAVVDSRYGRGGQNRQATITPEGSIALPVIGSVQAQGLTLPELQQELNECYREQIQGMEIIPVLVQRAPRYVYVLGEVGTPGRFELTGPTTVLQALSMAGSWNVGAHLRQIVIFRRGDDWRLMATMVDLQATLHGKQACPAGEIWLSDSDVIIVPKSPILRADDFIELVFTRGLYGVIPIQATVNFSKLSSI